MNASRWKSGDEFALLDLVAWFTFRSDTSVSFYLGTRSGIESTAIGWVDVHHPCAGHIKTQIRLCLPERYHSREQMSALVVQIMAKLEIPADETYEALILFPAKGWAIAQEIDRHGMTNRLY